MTERFDITEWSEEEAYFHGAQAGFTAGSIETTITPPWVARSQVVTDEKMTNVERYLDGFELGHSYGTALRSGIYSRTFCAHCRRPDSDGHGMVGDQRLCHPDYGMDCYKLVTVYHHPMPCDCRGTGHAAKGI